MISKYRAKSSTTNPYTDHEVSLLKEMWPTAKSKKELLECFPNRTYTGLLYKAGMLGLSCPAYTRRRRGSLVPLLNGSLKSFYWLGFILADGHFTKTGQLNVMISNKDEAHLKKLATFLETSVTCPYKNDKTKVRVTVQSLNESKNIQEMLGLSDTNKTINPPNVMVWSKFSEKQIKALFIGFFDGDGSKSGGIEVHHTWLPVLKFFENKKLMTNCRIRNKYAFGRCFYDMRNELTHFCKVNNIPFLSRKWVTEGDEND